MPIFSYYYYLLPTDKVVPTGRFSQTVHLEKESTRSSPISIEISARSAGTPQPLIPLLVAFPACSENSDPSHGAIAPNPTERATFLPAERMGGSRSPILVQVQVHFRALLYAGG